MWYEKTIGDKLPESDADFCATISYHWTMSPEERVALAKSVLYMHLAAKKALEQEDWKKSEEFLLKTLELLDANKKYGLKGFTIAFDASLAHCYLAYAYNHLRDETKCVEHIKKAFAMYHAPIPSIRRTVIINSDNIEHKYEFTGYIIILL